MSAPPVLLRTQLILATILLGSTGCPSEAGRPGDARTTSSASSPTGAQAMTITLTSTAFKEGQPIPVKHTGEGEDLSPPLAWTGVPAGTKELALICDDPDAPTPQPWVHWVLYKVPPTVTSLGEGVPAKPKLDQPPGALQGKNSWPTGRTIGYRGPLPPKGHGQHRYFFRVYALDIQLKLEAGASKESLLEEMQGHVLAQGQLMGTYSR
jgi:Raf kinase inhibitor-like YbhB/YbcL family protein